MSGVAGEEVSGNDGGTEVRGTAMSRALQAIADLDQSARRIVIDTPHGFATWREWGSGPAVVLLHGGAGSWKHFFHQIDYLSRDRRVIAADMPGFGDSSDSPSQTAPEEMASILSAGIDQIVGSEAFHLVGFSYGGIIGGYLARRLPARVAGFVLVGAVGFEARNQTVSLSRWRQLEDIEARRAVHRNNLAALMIAEPDRIDDTAILIQEWNAQQSRHDTRPTAHARPLTRVLDDSDVPLAAIWGERDQLAAPNFDERRAWLAARDLQAPFRLVPDAGHWVQYEAPDAFNEILGECIRSFDGRRRMSGQPLQGGKHGR